MKKIPRILIPTDPVGIDRACGTIQTKLGERFEWLNHVFGKSQLLVKQKGSSKFRYGTDYQYPAVHFKDRTYLDMLPDQKYGNFSFFIIEDPQEIEDFIPHHLAKIHVRYSIVFWFNLETIQTSKKTRELEKVKMDILRVLNTEMRFQNARLTVESIAERAASIYKEYSIKEVDQQFLMQPYAALRFSGKMTINELC